MKNSIAIICGGTGGHVFPALSLKEELLKLDEKVTFCVDQRGFRFVPHNMNVVEVAIHRSFPPLGKFFYPFSLFGAFLSYTIRFILDRPKLVVGFGGYPTMPGILAAFVLRIPIVIHEGNSFLGKANRFLQKFAKKICVSFHGTKTDYMAKTIVTGMPVRSAIRHKNYTYIEPREDEPFHLLVIGGSQAASLFTKLIPDAINDLSVDQQRRFVIHQQCKADQIDLAYAEYKTLPVSVTIKPFFNDMENQYEFAHLVIARSGSSSVFEIIHTKRPAIFFPFAAAIEGDQAKNAKNVEDKNACWVLNEKEAGPRVLAKLLSDLMDNPHLLTEKSKSIAKLQSEDATHAFAKMLKNDL
ncbi:MAG: UDP-N-acetylglucosamine--N-acetylmuramyl-(pentapeptide) pyrophosphoryl-undecaprenol N-acetylglucosamine transferase [Proteobacteria bacterium]|nr:UDP-N-acetylglucosamine--N-acetylmuramyl-(pentapeptide) pyrophosphoryl-undecaprenol N-acetylglucosamine transferase [Pseudomonadota bacterium]